jgi:hypothetical protein
MTVLARTVRASLAALVLAGAVTATAFAGTTDRFEDAFVITKTYSCGVVETTNVSLVGTAYFAEDGTWIRSLVRFEFDGMLLDPTTGEQIDLKGRQLLAEAPGQFALAGQGTFIRVPGSGVVAHDVGRLIVNLPDGSTIFSSAKVIEFDDPDAGAMVDAAVCALFD